MSNSNMEQVISRLLVKDPRYTPEAYCFVSEAVNYTVAKLDAHRHVSARELLEGAKSFAAGKYGVVSGLVLESWGLKTACDLGQVVYLLISEGVLSASDDDDIEDFNIEFSFEHHTLNQESC